MEATDDFYLLISSGYQTWTLTDLGKCVCGNKLWWTRAVPSMVLTVMDHAPQPVDDRVHRWVVPPADLRRRERAERQGVRGCVSLTHRDPPPLTPRMVQPV